MLICETARYPALTAQTEKSGRRINEMFEARSSTRKSRGVFSTPFPKTRRKSRSSPTRCRHGCSAGNDDECKSEGENSEEEKSSAGRSSASNPSNRAIMEHRRDQNRFGNKPLRPTALKKYWTLPSISTVNFASQNRRRIAQKTFGACERICVPSFVGFDKDHERFRFSDELS